MTTILEHIRFGTLLYLCLVAYVVWITGVATKWSEIGIRDYRWLLVLLSLSGVLSTVIPLDNWPVGPGLVVLSGWCILRVVDMWWRRESHRGWDLGPMIACAVAGMVLIVFLIAGCTKNSALSGRVLMMAQLTAALLYWFTVASLSKRTNTNYYDISFAKPPPHLMPLFRFLLLSVFLGALLWVASYGLEFFGRAPATFDGNRHFAVFDAEKYVILIWLNSFLGPLLYFLTRSVFLRFTGSGKQPPK